MPRPTTILVVDDDTAITALLCDYLGRFGYRCVSAADGTAMWRALDEQPIDLVVLDLMLPGDDGLTLARAMRARSRLPIIMLSARGGAADRVVGLEMGADDYLTKPFEPRELAARIKTVLWRSGSLKTAEPPTPPADVVRFDGWMLQRHERQLQSPQGVLVPLSNAEYRLLDVFLKAPRRVVSRDTLLAQARNRAGESAGRSIDLLVSRLRQKLLGGEGELIKTVRGAGYIFDARSVQELASLRH